MCINPIKLASGQTVPCGQCMPCRINHCRQWAVRIMYERAMSKDGCFVTLTYDDEHLPMKSPKYLEPTSAAGTLCRRDVQLFMKRLRKKFPPGSVKYYAAGEYGLEGDRPHYHLILFNVPPDERIISEAWQYRGLVSVDDVNYTTSEYCAKYVLSKEYGLSAVKAYELTRREAPFQLSSQGLGLEFAKGTINEIKTRDCCYVTGKPVPVPKYFREKLDLNSYKAQVRAFRNNLNLSTKVFNSKYPHDFSPDLIVVRREYLKYLRSCGRSVSKYKREDFVNWLFVTDNVIASHFVYELLSTHLVNKLADVQGAVMSKS